MSFLGNTKVTGQNQTEVYASPVDKESNIHTIAVLNEGITPNETVKVTLSYYDASEPSTRAFTIFEVEPQSSFEYTKTINLQPGDKLLAETDGGDVNILVGAFLDTDSFVSDTFNIRGEYDPTLTYDSFDVVYYNGATYVSTVNGQIGNDPDDTGSSGGWTPLGSGFYAYGDWETGFIYPPLSVVTHAGAVWVAPTGADADAEPGVDSAWTSFSSLQSAEISDSSSVGGPNVAASLTILDQRLDNIDTGDVPEVAGVDLDPTPGNEQAYFSQTRVRDSLSAAGDLTYDPATGTFTAFTLSEGDVNSFIDNRVTKPYLDALNVDADTLDGVDILQIARTDVNEIFEQDISVSGLIYGDLFGNVLASDSSRAVDTTGEITVFNGDLVGNSTGFHTGDVNGNIIQDDSTILVNASTGILQGELQGTVDARAVLGTSYFTDLEITGDLTVSTLIQGNISSTGTSTFANIDINGGTIDGAIINASGVLTAGSIEAIGQIEAPLFLGEFQASTGSTSRFDNLIVQGELTFSELEVQGNAELKSDVTVGGQLTVAGETTFTDVNITGGNIAGVQIGSGSLPADMVASVVTVSDILNAEQASAKFGDVTVVGRFVSQDALEADVKGNLISSDESSLVVDTFNRRVIADLVGDVTGNVSGDVTGNVTGNLVGNVVAIGGTSTFNTLNSDVITVTDINITGNATFGTDLSFTDLSLTTLDVNNTIKVDGVSTLASVEIGGGTINNVSIGQETNGAGVITGTEITAIDNFTGELRGNVVGSLEGRVDGELYGDVFSINSTKLVDAFNNRFLGNVDVRGLGGTSYFDNVVVDGNFNVATIVSEDIRGTLDGNLVGDVYASDGLKKVLESGNGTNIPASFEGNVTGEVDGRFTGIAEGNFYGDVYTVDSTRVIDGFSGNIFGDLTGDVIGNLSGNVNAISGTSRFNNLEVSGSIDLSGASGNISANVIGDLTGRVLATDDTVVVDAGNGVNPAEFFGNLTGSVFGNIIANSSSDLSILGTVNILEEVIGDIRGNVLASTGDIIVNYLTENIAANTIEARGSFDGTLRGNVDVRGLGGTSYFDSIRVSGDIDLSGASGNISADVIGNLTGDVFNNVAQKVLDSGGTGIPALLTGNVEGNITGELIGDVYSSNGAFRVLDSGTDGSDAFLVAEVSGDLRGNVLAADSTIIVNADQREVNANVQGNINTETGQSQLNDLIVLGDLTVQGDMTAVQTTDLEISDNTITLNVGETGSGVSRSTSGISIDRGILPNTSLNWTENAFDDSGYWNFGDSEVRADSFTADIGITGDLTGDIYSTNGVRILRSGTTGANATFTGNVTGQLFGNVTAESGVSNFVNIQVLEEINGTLRGSVLGEDSTQIVNPFNNEVTGSIVRADNKFVGDIEGNVTIFSGTSIFNDIDIRGDIQFNELNINNSVISNDLEVGRNLDVASGTATLNNVAISSGTIESTAIGVNTPSQLKATRIDVTNGDVIVEVGNIDVASGNIIADTITARSRFDGDLEGNVSGNVTGNVSGDLTGNVIADDSTTILVNAASQRFTGDITGNVTGDVTGNITGDVQGNIEGSLFGDVFFSGGTTPILDTGSETIPAQYRGNVIGDVSGNLIGSVTGDVSGDVQGNVIAEDSTTILVNAGTQKFTGDITSTGTSFFNNIDVSGNLSFQQFNLDEITVGTLLQVDGTANINRLNATSGNIDNVIIGDTTPRRITGTEITADDRFIGLLQGNVQGDVSGDLSGNVKADDSSIIVDYEQKKFTGSFIGDVFSSDFTRVLDAGTDGTNATFTGDVTGDIESTGTSQFNNIIQTNGTATFETASIENLTVTGTIDSNIDVTSGTSFFNVLDANDLIVRQGTLDGVRIGTTDPDTVRGTIITADTGFQGNVTGDITGPGISRFRSIEVQEEITGVVRGNVIGDDSSTIIDVFTRDINGETITANNFSGDLQGDITSSGTSQFVNLNTTGTVTLDTATVTNDITVDGNVVGNVVGNVQGDITGNLTGNVTGDITGPGISRFRSIEVEEEITGTVRGDVIADDSSTIINVFNKDITGRQITATSGFVGDIDGNIDARGTGGKSWFEDIESLGFVRLDTATITNDLTVDGDLRGNMIGNVRGDIQSQNGVRILDSGTDGTDATFLGDVTGRVTGDIVGSVLGDDSSVIVNYLSKRMTGSFEGSVYSDNNVKILNNGIDGTDALLIGNVDAANGVSKFTDIDQYAGGVADLQTVNVAQDLTVTGDIIGNVNVPTGLSRFFDVNLDNDLVVDGNLTVKGTTTTVDTQQILLADNIITLNSDLDNLTAPTQDAGIEINRGSEDARRFIWDETLDKWTIEGERFDAGFVYSSGGFQGDITGDVTGNVSGDVTGNVTGNITGPGISRFRSIEVEEEITGVVRGDVIADDSSTIINVFNKDITGRTVTAENFSGNITSPGTSQFVNLNTTGTVSLNTATVENDLTVIGSLIGDVEGNVQGDVTGNLTGNVTGDITGPGISRFRSIEVEEEITGVVRGNVIADDSSTIINVFNRDITGRTVTADDFVGELTGNVDGRGAGNRSYFEEIEVDGAFILNNAAGLVGAVTGDVTGNLIGDIVASDTVTKVLEAGNGTSINATYKGDVIALDDTSIVDASSKTVTATSFVGDVLGNVDGNITGNVLGQDTVTLLDSVSRTLTGDVTGDVTSSGTSTFADVRINGGNIENTEIGSNGNTADITGDTITAETNFSGLLLGSLTGDVEGDLRGNVLAATDLSTVVVDAFNRVVTADLYGDVYSENDTAILTRGIDGTDAVFRGKVIGNVDARSTLGKTFLNELQTYGDVVFDRAQVTNDLTVDGTVIGDVTGDITGDVYSTNGTRILNNGNDGTDAVYTGSVEGDINSIGTSTFEDVTVNGVLTANNSIVGNLTGNVDGNVTGNVVSENSGDIINSVTRQINGSIITADSGFVGDLTGDVFGDLQGNVNANSGTSIFKNVTITGTVDFADLEVTDIEITNNADIGQNLTVVGLATLANVDINSGRIGGVVIGGDGNPQAGTFTTVTATTTNSTTVNADNININAGSGHQFTGPLVGDVTGGLTAQSSSTIDVSSATSLVFAADQISGNAVDGGTISNANLAGDGINTITGYNITLGATHNLDVSAGEILLRNQQISGDVIANGTINNASLIGNNSTNSITGYNITLDSGRTLTVNGETDLNLLNVSGLASLDGGINVNDLFSVSQFSGNVVTSGNLSAGNTVINGSLDIGGPVSIQGDSSDSVSNTSGALIIEGGVGIGKSVNIGGSVDIDNDLTAGNTVIEGTLDVTNLATLAGGIDVAGAFSVETGTGNVIASGTLESGNTNILGTLDVTGSATLNGSLDVEGATYIDNILEATGSTVLGSTVDIGGTTTLASAADFVMYNSNPSIVFSVDGATGNTFTEGSVDITGDLSVGGDTQSISTLTGALVVAGGVGIEKDVFTGGNLNVAGDITFGGNINLNAITLNAVAFLNGGINVDNKFTVSGINGDVFTQGSLEAGSTVLSGTLDVTGTVVIEGDSTNSISNSTGSLVVQGGVGIASNVNAGGNLDIDGFGIFGGDLTVSGNTLISGTATVADDTTIGGNVRVINRSAATGLAIDVVNDVTQSIFTVNGVDGQTFISTNLTVGTDLLVEGSTVIKGDLTVEGDTITISAATLDVEDRNITLAKGATTAGEADGGGITLEGANALFTYTSGNDRWNLNKDLTVPTVIGNVTGDITGAVTTPVGDTFELRGDFDVNAQNTGSLDNVVIGGITKRAGTFTSVTADTLNLTGTGSISTNSGDISSQTGNIQTVDGSITTTNGDISGNIITANTRFQGDIEGATAQFSDALDLTGDASVTLAGGDVATISGSFSTASGSFSTTSGDMTAQTITANNVFLGQLGEDDSTVAGAQSRQAAYVSTLDTLSTLSVNGLSLLNNGLIVEGTAQFNGNINAAVGTTAEFDSVVINGDFDVATITINDFSVQDTLEVGGQVTAEQGIEVKGLLDSVNSQLSSATITLSDIDSTPIGQNTASTGRFSRLTVTTDNVTFEDGDVTLQNGDLILSSGDIDIDAGSLTVNTDITVGNNVTVTNDITVSGFVFATSDTNNGLVGDVYAWDGTTATKILQAGTGTDAIFTGDVEGNVTAANGTSSFTAIEASGLIEANGGIEGDLTSSTVDIDGGFIDNTAIGENIRSSAKFSDMQTTAATINSGQINSVTIGSPTTGKADGYFNILDAENINLTGGSISNITIAPGGSGRASANFTTVDATGTITGTHKGDILNDADTTMFDSSANTIVVESVETEAAQGFIGNVTASTGTSSFATLTANSVDLDGGTIDGADIGLGAGGARDAKFVNMEAATVDINSGDIDSVTIGSAGRADGYFNILDADAINLTGGSISNVTIAPSGGRSSANFTTVDATGTITGTHKGDILNDANNTVFNSVANTITIDTITATTFEGNVDASTGTSSFATLTASVVDINSGAIDGTDIGLAAGGARDAKFQNMEAGAVQIDGGQIDSVTIGSAGTGRADGFFDVLDAEDINLTGGSISNIQIAPSGGRAAANFTTVDATGTITGTHKGNVLATDDTPIINHVDNTIQTNTVTATTFNGNVNTAVGTSNFATINANTVNSSLVGNVTGTVTGQIIADTLSSGRSRFWNVTVNGDTGITTTDINVNGSADLGSSITATGGTLQGITINSGLGINSTPIGAGDPSNRAAGFFQTLEVTNTINSDINSSGTSQFQSVQIFADSSITADITMQGDLNVTGEVDAIIKTKSGSLISNTPIENCIVGNNGNTAAVNGTVITGDSIRSIGPLQVDGLATLFKISAINDQEHEIRKLESNEFKSTGATITGGSINNTVIGDSIPVDITGEIITADTRFEGQINSVSARNPIPGDERVGYFTELFVDQITTGDIAVTADQNFETLTVGLGGLTVQGSTSLLQDLSIESEFITLNANATIANTSGLRIERPGETPSVVNFLWDQVGDTFTIGDEDFETSGEITADRFIGQITATTAGTSTFNNLNVQIAADLGNSVTIEGGQITNTQIGTSNPAVGNSTVFGTTITAHNKFEGDIDSSGDSDFNTATFTGLITANGGINGNITGVIDGTTNSKIVGGFIESSTIGRDSGGNEKRGAGFFTNIEANGTITATASQGFVGNVNAPTGTSSFDVLEASGNTTLIGTTINGDLTMGAGTTASFQSIEVSGLVEFQDLEISQTLDVTGDFQVIGSDPANPKFTVNSATGAAEVDGALTVTGNSTMQGNLQVQGNTTIGDAGTDEISFNAKLASDLLVDSNNTRNFGDSTNRIATVFTNQVNTSGDVTIGGNLTIRGGTTVVESETVAISDNIIVLNSNVTGTPGEDAGIEIERGTEPNVSFFWDEAAGEFTIGSQTLNASVFKGDINSSADTTLIDFINRTITNITDITNSGILNTGSLEVTGAAEIGTTLDVAGDATFESNVLVSGLTNNRIVFAGTSGTLVDDANLTFNGSTFNVGGSNFAITAASGDVEASGDVDIGGDVEVTGTVTSLGNFDVATDRFTVNATSGNTGVAGTFAVSGLSTLSTLSVTNDATVIGVLNANGGIAVDTDRFTVADATGNTNIEGTLAVQSLMRPNGGINVNAGVFTVVGGTGNTDIAGTLDVTGESTLASATISDLSQNGIVLAGPSGSLETNTNITFTGSQFAIGTDKLTVNSTTGNSAFAGEVTFSDNVLLDTAATFTIENADTPTATVFEVDGSTGDTDIAGTLAVEGEATFEDTVSLSTLSATSIPVIGGAGAITESTDLVFTSTQLSVGTGRFTVNRSSGNILTQGTLNVAGATTLDDLTVGGSAVIQEEIQSNSPSTGSLRTLGGLGVAFNANIGGDLTVNGNVNVTGGTILGTTIGSTASPAPAVEATQITGTNITGSNIEGPVTSSNVDITGGIINGTVIGGGASTDAQFTPDAIRGTAIYAEQGFKGNIDSRPSQGVGTTGSDFLANTTVTGTLSVDSNTTLSGDLSVTNGNTTISGGTIDGVDIGQTVPGDIKGQTVEATGKFEGDIDSPVLSNFNAVALTGNIEQTVAGTTASFQNLTAANFNPSDLTITGQVEFFEPIFTLNADFVGDDPTANAGFRVERDQAGDKSFVWEELGSGQGRWTIGDETFRAGTVNASSGVISPQFTGDLTGNVTGNADTATALETSRTITITGDVVGSADFNGTQNISINTEINLSVVQLGVQTSGNYAEDLTIAANSGLILQGTPGAGTNYILDTNATPNDLPERIVSRDAAGDFSAGTITATFVGNIEGNVSGNVTGQIDGTGGGTSEFDDIEAVTATIQTVTIGNSSTPGAINYTDIGLSPGGARDIKGKVITADTRFIGPIRGNVLASDDTTIMVNSGTRKITALDLEGTIGADTAFDGTFLDLNAASITETSSIKYKENVVEIENALDKVTQLQGVTYDRKDGSAQNEAGLIAEEVEKILPNVVEYKDGEADGLHYTRIIAYLVESIKELKTEIKELKEKN